MSVVNLTQRLKDAKSQDERWQLLEQASTVEERELICTKIILNATTERELEKVRAKAPQGGAAEATATYFLEGATD